MSCIIRGLAHEVSKEFRVYLEGQGDLVSRLISHRLIPDPIVNLLIKSL